MAQSSNGPTIVHIHSTTANDVPPRRFRGVFSAMSFVVLGFVFLQNKSSIHTTSDGMKQIKDNSTVTIDETEGMSIPDQSKDEAEATHHVDSVPDSLLPSVEASTASTQNSTTTSSCIRSDCNRMGIPIIESRPELVANLSMNRNAHIMTFPYNTARNEQGQRIRLCVPQKNGNNQFSGLMYAAWNGEPPKEAKRAVKNAKKWEVREFHSGSHADRTSHVYFISRNPYTRMLSLYLQKVANECISSNQLGCVKPKGWNGIRSDNNFTQFMKKIDKMVARHDGSLCRTNHHLCQQVESCVTTTLVAQNVTILRLEDQSCWFPCLVSQLGMKESLLANKGWKTFSGHSCYYTATGRCKDMMKSLDPSKVKVMTGNVHATGASNKLAQHYTPEAAAIVSRLYADDFRILKYPLWDGVS